MSMPNANLGMFHMLYILRFYTIENPVSRYAGTSLGLKDNSSPT